MDRLTCDTNGKSGVGLTFDLKVECPNTDEAIKLQRLIIRLGLLESAVADENKHYDLDRLRELAEADRDEREVVHARWIPDPRQWSASQCSRCATPAPWKRGCANVQCLTPHCQNCGALMDLYGKDENGD